MLLLLLSTLAWWHWLVLAMLLVILEIAAPSFWFLWIGAAAGIMTLVTLAAPALHWESQLLLFGAVSMATLLVQWAILRRVTPGRSDQPSLNRRGEQYAGRRLTLVEPIDNGYGVVRVDDTRWRVSGPPLPAGRVVRVIGTDGMTLRVESAEDAGDTIGEKPPPPPTATGRGA